MGRKELASQFVENFDKGAHISNGISIFVAIAAPQAALASILLTEGVGRPIRDRLDKYANS